MSETGSVTLANARVILGGEVVTGAVQIVRGEIVSVDQGSAVSPDAIDCEGDYVSPSMIELHTDNLERHLAPRPGVKWPHKVAILAHDAELAGVGIGTVFDAIRVGSILSGERSDYGRYARDVTREIDGLRQENVLRVSHQLHLRAEICSETLTEELAEFSVQDRVGIISLMDHTPGQRQFTDISKLRDYLKGKYGMNEERFEIHVENLYRIHAEFGADHEAAAVRESRRLGAILASHDDTTDEQVKVSATHGVALAEFPTTAEAARSCRSQGILVMMGAPNLLRGGSHSGNVSAGELADNGLLDILSSDYAPSSLLAGAVRLGLESGDMAKGLATVTAAPAQAAALQDRGKIEPGLRGDVIRFAMVGDVPVLRGNWVRGRRVA